MKIKKVDKIDDYVNRFLLRFKRTKMAQNENVYDVQLISWEMFTYGNTTRHLTSWFLRHISWVSGWLVRWLAGWLVGEWISEWVTGRLPVCLSVWLIGWFPGWLAGWQATHSLTHILTDSLTHSHTHLLTHSLTHSHTHSHTLTLTHTLTHTHTLSLIQCLCLCICVPAHRGVHECARLYLGARGMHNCDDANAKLLCTSHFRNKRHPQCVGKTPLEKRASYQKLSIKMDNWWGASAEVEWGERLTRWSIVNTEQVIIKLLLLAKYQRASFAFYSLMSLLALVR